MPITAIYNKSLVTAAAQAESMTAAQAKALLGAAPTGWLPTLVNHANDPVANGASLVEWKAAFPTLLGSLSDRDASFLIRVAVAAAGGVAI